MRTFRKNNQNMRRDRGPAVFSQFMQKKLGATVTVVLLALFALLGVVYVIQRDNHEAYNKIVLSQRQSEYSSTTIPYRRGDIYDRNGNKLASSDRVYSLILDPDQMREAEGDTSGGKPAQRSIIEPTIDALAQYFGYDKAELRSIIDNNPKSRYVLYQKEVSYNDKKGFEDLAAKLNEQYSSSEKTEERKKRIKGVWFQNDYKRNYPYGSLACNVIGFLSRDGKNGTGGVEQFYNDELTGTDGREYGYLNDEANLESVVKPAQNGNTLVLTIDTNIQGIVEKYLAEWKNGDIGSNSASCIVMNPKNGEVLAMASTNSFDLNNPRTTEGYTEDQLYQMGLEEGVRYYKQDKEKNPNGGSITAEQVPQSYSREQILSFGSQMAWNQLWRNIPVSDTFEPGSTQKIFTVGGAMDEGIIKPTDTFDCKGYVSLSDGSKTWQINCVNRNGHGLLDVKGGLTQSCNVVMMNIAFLEKSETFMKYQHIFGFGDYTGIDLPAEAKGLGISDEAIGKTQLATNSFGQNYTCTMIQMAAAYCSVLNGGYYYQPHVVKQILTEDGAVAKDVEPLLVRETISQSTCDFLKEALFETVETGTGKAAGVPGYHIGGKTGTAQKLPRSARTYAVSFCGFAPVEDPQLLCYVMIDEPHRPGQEAAHSSFASGIFAKIMAEALPAINLYPEGTDGADYKAPQAVLPEAEGDSAETMGNAETLAPAETTQVPTDEDGQTLMAPTETGEGAATAPAKPPETDEFVQGDGQDAELPDDLSDDIAKDAGETGAAPQIQPAENTAQDGAGQTQQAGTAQPNQTGETGAGTTAAAP